MYVAEPAAQIERIDLLLLHPDIALADEHERIPLIAEEGDDLLGVRNEAELAVIRLLERAHADFAALERCGFVVLAEPVLAKPLIGSPERIRIAIAGELVQMPRVGVDLLRKTDIDVFLEASDGSGVRNPVVEEDRQELDEVHERLVVCG